jgi:cysteine-rich repeat protein
MEWYENGGSARARLRWSSASQAKEAIAAAQLQGVPTPDAPPIAVTDGAGYDRGGSVPIAVLSNDLDDASGLDPASLVLGTPLHGSVVFDPVSGVVTYTHDGSATPTDHFTYSVEDTSNLVSNTTSVLLDLIPTCGDGVLSGPENCEDGNSADGDCCSSACQYEASGSACTDDDLCTDVDICDGVGTCVPGPPLSCDDLAFCNGLETCDPAGGCQSGTPPLLDDAVDCTVDSCDEVSDQILNEPDDYECNDGLVCTADSCDEVLGCVSVHIEGCTPVPTTGGWARGVLIGLYLAGGIAILTIRRRSTT